MRIMLIRALRGQAVERGTFCGQFAHQTLSFDKRQPTQRNRGGKSP
ncbi:hypothetical protein [Sulfitobacter sabulilitoris]|nr:hypothetical protein [Sulfitobacter sabulilitoris]